MNGFLVLANTAMDDVPLYFVDSEERAEQLASQVTQDHVVNVARSTMNRDVSRELVECVSIVKFVEGFSISLTVGKVFT